MIELAQIAVNIRGAVTIKIGDEKRHQVRWDVLEHWRRHMDLGQDRTVKAVV